MHGVYIGLHVKDDIACIGRAIIARQRIPSTSHQRSSPESTSRPHVTSRLRKARTHLCRGVAFLEHPFCLAIQQMRIQRCHHLVVAAKALHSLG